jgi:hypothetical protein
LQIELEQMKMSTEESRESQVGNPQGAALKSSPLVFEGWGVWHGGEYVAPLSWLQSTFRLLIAWCCWLASSWSRNLAAIFRGGNGADLPGSYPWVWPISVLMFARKRPASQHLAGLARGLTGRLYRIDQSIQTLFIPLRVQAVEVGTSHRFILSGRGVVVDGLKFKKYLLKELFFLRGGRGGKNVLRKIFSERDGQQHEKTLNLEKSYKRCLA